jgi:hypothetical protein
MAVVKCKSPSFAAPGGVMESNQVLRTTGVTVLTLAALAALGVILVRDQIHRHRRELFSPHPIRRLAALGYLSREPASVDNILLLRDFMSWEQQPLLRRRATAVVERMEDALAARAISPESA